MRVIFVLCGVKKYLRFSLFSKIFVMLGHFEFEPILGQFSNILWKKSVLGASGQSRSFSSNLHYLVKFDRLLFFHRFLIFHIFVIFSTFSAIFRSIPLISLSK